MNLLLDTHVFIWLNTHLSKISQKALTICENPDNQLYLSPRRAYKRSVIRRMEKMVCDAIADAPYACFNTV